MKTLEQQQAEAREIMSQALLDGQNQIHDLRSCKSTPQEIEERMARAYEYHGNRLNTLVARIVHETREGVLEEMREGVQTSLEKRKYVECDTLDDKHGWRQKGKSGAYESYTDRFTATWHNKILDECEQVILTHITSLRNETV
jgi:hypothetical protein